MLNSIILSMAMTLSTPTAIDTQNFDSVNLDNGHANELIEAKRGDVRIEAKRGDVRIEAKRGDVRIEAKRGDVRIEAKRGDVRI